MNYSFLLILLFPIISTNELLYSSEESSSIFPLQLGKLYETNNTSTKACLFLFFDDLKLIDLHNIKVPYLGRNLSICPGEESALYLEDAPNKLIISCLSCISMSSFCVKLFSIL